MLAKQRRAHVRETFFAGALARLQAEHGFARALGTALRDAREFFLAGNALLAARERETGRSVLWAVPSAAGQAAAARLAELDRGAGDDWLGTTVADAWDAIRRRGGWHVLALDTEGRIVRDERAVPRDGLDRLAARTNGRRLTGVGYGSGTEWEARLVLVDARLDGRPAEYLRFAQRLVRELGGVLQARFMLGRLRSRVGALERARIARELHDGTIQSLVAVEMELEVMRRRAEQRGSPMVEDVARVAKLLRSEILDLRDTMQRLKPIEVEPSQLVGFLDAAVARFERDSGIHALFDCSVEDVDLPPGFCREVARIVQEALHNVRKHSGARHVVVRFGSAEGGAFRLVVDDDGRGFPFSGNLSHAELDEGRKGPFVIKERVRALGGELTIVTSPGGGARLDILLPREAR
jgi:signal transduction histidine kinase